MNEARSRRTTVISLCKHTARKLKLPPVDIHMEDHLRALFEAAREAQNEEQDTHGDNTQQIVGESGRVLVTTGDLLEDHRLLRVVAESLRGTINALETENKRLKEENVRLTKSQSTPLPNTFAEARAIAQSEPMGFYQTCIDHHQPQAAEDYLKAWSFNQSLHGPCKTELLNLEILQCEDSWYPEFLTWFAEYPPIKSVNSAR